MKALSSILIALVGSLFLVPMSSAAPDTAPALTWENQLTNAACPDQESDFNVQVTLDAAGNSYASSQCANSDSDDVLVSSFTPAGSIRWASVIPAATTLQTRSVIGIIVDPAERVIVWVHDEGLTPANHALVFLNANTGSVLFAHADFSFDTQGQGSAKQLTLKELNATSLRYFGGEDQFRFSVTCVNATDAGCVTDWEFGTNPNGRWVNYGGPYLDTLFQGSTAASNNLRIVNQATGLLDDQESYGTSGLPWVNPVDNTTGYVTYASVSGGSTVNKFFEFNTSTLASIRDVEPIESTVATYPQTIQNVGILDAEENLFYCGRAQSAGVKIDGFLAKYNTTVNAGQRWNITISKQAGASEVERVFDCSLDQTGALFATFQSCASGSSQCSNYLRKYASAGSPRAEQEVFDAFPGAVVTTSPFAGNADGAIGFRNFCILNGFESDAGKFLCGLVYVLSGTVLMAAVTRDLSKNAVLAIAAATAFGLMIFVTIVELWPTYTTVLIIILCSAVVIWAIKKQFLGFGGDE